LEGFKLPSKEGLSCVRSNLKGLQAATVERKSQPFELEGA
ncbi:hypothetical protein TorRG33x02_326990, partial [Trema orientale]